MTTYDNRPDTNPGTPALPPSSPKLDDAPEKSCPNRRHGFLAGLVLGAIGAGLIGLAIGATMPVAEAALGALSHVGSDGPPTIDEARDHAEFFAAFALHRLDATPEQQQSVRKIVDSTVDGLFPIVAKHHANRDQLHAILEAPVIDRAAIERLRGEEIALADNLSRVVASSVADAAEVLTMEQRSELVEHLKRFRHHH